MTEVQAIGKYLRITPRKLTPVAALVKRKKATDALKRLKFVDKKGARFLANVLKSAISNAKNNLSLTEDSLVIKKIEVGKGPMLKRWQPVSRGRAHPILKRMSHLKVVLESVEQTSVQPENEVKTDKQASLSQIANRQSSKTKNKAISDMPKAKSATEGS